MTTSLIHCMIYVCQLIDAGLSTSKKKKGKHLGNWCYASNYVSWGVRAWGAEKRCWDGKVCLLPITKSHSDAKKAKN